MKYTCGSQNTAIDHALHSHGKSHNTVKPKKVKKQSRQEKLKAGKSTTKTRKKRDKNVESFVEISSSLPALNTKPKLKRSKGSPRIGTKDTHVETRRKTSNLKLLQTELGKRAELCIEARNSWQKYTPEDTDNSKKKSEKIVKIKKNKKKTGQHNGNIVTHRTDSMIDGDSFDEKNRSHDEYKKKKKKKKEKSRSGKGNGCVQKE